MKALSSSKYDQPKYLFPPAVFLALSIFFLPKICPAQNTGTIEGKITGAKTSLPVAGANIVIDGTDYGAAADSAGSFRIEAIPAGRYTLKVLVIGYETFEKTIDIKSESRAFVSVQLSPTILAGPEISIERQRMQDARLTISPPTYDIDPRLIEARAGAFEDILRFVQTMPGVITPNDFSNQFIVRGGGPDQNLIILDGVELFSPYRQNGMASVFNPAIVQDVKLYAGGFPAIFGDRLSSVLSVTSRDGTTGKWLGGRIGTSLTNANLLLEGKTNFWNGSWLVSGRRSYYDLFSRDFVHDLGIVNDIAFPDFRDAHAKLVLRPSPKHRLQMTGFYSENNMDYLAKEEIGEQVSENPGFDGEDRMENTILGGSWTYTPSERFQTRLYSNWYQNNGRSGLGGSLSSSGAFAGRSFSTGEAILTTPPGGQADTLSFDFNQRYEFRKFSFGNWWIYTSQKHIFEFGFGVDRLDNTLNSGIALDEYGELVFDALASAPNFFGALAGAIDQGRSYSRANVYLQDKILVRDGQFWLQPGIRYDYYGNIEKSYLSPRLSLLVKPRPQTSIRLSTGIYRQSPGYEKLLDGGRIFDLLQFSSLDDLIAENGVHFIAGLSEKISDHWNFSIEAYYKKLDDLVVQDFQFLTQPIPGLIIIGGSAPAQPGAYKIETAPVLQRISRPVNNANTEALGVDVFVEKKMASPDDRWGASLSLSIGKATQQQSVGQDGRVIRQMSFPYDFDRRFAVNAMASLNAGAGFRFSANWQYGSGFPYTPALRLDPLIGFANDTTIVGGEPVVSEEPFVLADPTTGYARFVPDYGPPENINSARLPDYHRLDIRISYNNNILNAPFEFYIDLANVYNRRNVFQYQPAIRIEGDNPNLPLALRFPKPVLFRRPIYMLPFVPSVGFNISF